MPTDARKFATAPRCILSALTYVAPVEGGWQTVNDGGDRGELSDADLHRRCVAVNAADNGEGIYSVVAASELPNVRRFVLNGHEKTVSLEGFEEDIAIDEFRKMAVRADAEGRIICSMAETLVAQMDKCREAGADRNADHLMDIRETAQSYANSEDEYELYDHHSYDLETSGLTDGLGYIDLLTKITRIGHADGPVHERFGLEQALPGWQEVRGLHGYMKTQIRHAFDAFMRDLLGEFPDDRVSMIARPRGVQISEALEEAGFALEGMLPPFDGGNMIPGYRTSDVGFHRANGVDVVVFTDFIGTYAYSWPTEEGGKFRMQAPPAFQMKLG